MVHFHESGNLTCDQKCLRGFFKLGFTATTAKVVVLTFQNTDITGIFNTNFHPTNRIDSFLHIDWILD